MTMIAPMMFCDALTFPLSDGTQQHVRTAARHDMARPALEHTDLASCCHLPLSNPLDPSFEFDTWAAFRRNLNYKLHLPMGVELDNMSQLALSGNPLPTHVPYRHHLWTVGHSQHQMQSPGRTFRSC